MVASLCTVPPQCVVKENKVFCMTKRKVPLSGHFGSRWTVAPCITCYFPLPPTHKGTRWKSDPVSTAQNFVLTGIQADLTARIHFLGQPKRVLSCREGWWRSVHHALPFPGGFWWILQSLGLITESRMVQTCQIPEDASRSGGYRSLVQELSWCIR